MRVFKWIVVAALCPLVAFAFEPEEHEQLSNDALTAAKHYEGSDAMRAAAAAIGTKFGNVTLAVDWFTDPSDNLLDPAKYEDELSRRGARKPIPFLRRSVAINNNSTHFQDEALAKWREYHEQAIRLAAAEVTARAALLAEAVALHYLQDFFSAGHLVTPRGGMHNAAAGQLHDYFNQRGVDFEFDESPEVSDAMDKLVAVGALPREHVDLYRTETGRKVLWHGDRWLDRRPSQKAFVAAITTLSVAEVFKSSVALRTTGLQLCFTDRAPILDDPDAAVLNVIGPDGGVRVVNVTGGHVPPVIPCADGDRWIARYKTLSDPELTRHRFALSGVDVRGEVAVANESRDVRVNVDLLFFVLADDPKGAETSKGMKLKMGTVGPTFLFSDRYEAWGLLYDYWMPVGDFRALSWGFRLAPRRYDYTEAQPWRLDAGLKGSVGIDVVNLVVAVERGHGIVPDGRFRPEYFFSVGGDIAIAEGWTDRVWESIKRRFGGS